VQIKEFAALAAGAAAVCALALGQPQATTWTGRVCDSSGKPIAGAVVRLESERGTFRAISGTDGGFTFPALGPGEYAISVENNHTIAAAGHKMQLPGAFSNAVLQLSKDGGLTVVRESPARESTGGQQLNNKAVSSLPLNKRDFSQLLLLAAGTMTDTNGAANFTQQFAVNGQRGTAAVFAMDGADSTDPENGGATFSNFNVDAVQEIQASSGWRRRSGAARPALQTSSRDRVRTRNTARHSSSSATPYWTRAISSTVAP
jgi:hypothetical protein